MISSPRIDFHVHLFPDKAFDAIWQYFDIHSAPVVYQFYTPQCIAYLQGQGVRQIVFSNYAHRKGIAAPMNRWNIDLLEQYDNLYCFAPYHPDDEDALAEAGRMLAHPRVVGIKLHFQVQCIYPHDPRLFEMYELVMARKKRLLLHVGNGPRGNRYVGFDQFHPVLVRYPDLPATVPHMGGLEFELFMGLLDQHPNLYLDTAYSFWPGMPFTFNLAPKRLEDHMERILYGSDFPNVILPREGEIDYLLEMGLSDAFYAKVFHENGARLLAQTCPLAMAKS